MSVKPIKNGQKTVDYFSLSELALKMHTDLSRLPVSIKILLENLLRHQNEESVSPGDIRALASWAETRGSSHKDIAYHPGRVIMQDFTGVPAVVDLAAMRDALEEAGGDGSSINPVIPVDLVVDHSVSVDHYASSDAYSYNVKKEYERNSERYRLLNWAQKAFDNFRVVPPGTGIVHQVNLEFLADVITVRDGTAFPDTVVGTDSHTTMIGALAVLGWGVGGIEAEAALLGQPVTMMIPEVIGFRMEGALPEGATATDLVLTVTQMLRTRGVVGKFVEFYGPGLDNLTLADRATISNMAPEYGATCGLFPIDEELIKYLRLSGRDEGHIQFVKEYALEQGLWRDGKTEPVFTDTLSLDLCEVRPSMAGPRRPQDRVVLTSAASGFKRALTETYGVSDPEKTMEVRGESYRLSHGHVAIAAITSCTNTSNPGILMAAGLLARKAVERGLRSKPWVKTSFAPGSKVVTTYLEKAGLITYLEQLGFHLVGYGCTTCIGNSGPLPEHITEAITEGDLVTCNVLSGNRNFEGRISPVSRASYLASPPLVVAYALAGSLKTDITRDALGEDREGNPVYLKDLWPTSREIEEEIHKNVSPEMFRARYADVFTGTPEWADLSLEKSILFDWDSESTYIRKPPFFDGFTKGLKMEDISGARCLGIMPDSTTTDHISPAGAIPREEPAGRYLLQKGTVFEDFNSFGSRRGNHEVMMRGTFGNIRLKNRMAGGREGGYTRNARGETATIFETSREFQEENIPLIIMAGKEYGTGSSRDWAAKGPLLLGVKAVIAESYERIHRSNLLGMGILPLEFMNDQSAESLSLTGAELFDIRGIAQMKAGGELQLIVKDGKTEKKISVKVRIDTGQEMEFYKAGGILRYVLKNMKN